MGLDDPYFPKARESFWSGRQVDISKRDFFIFEGSINKNTATQCAIDLSKNEFTFMSPPLLDLYQNLMSEYDQEVQYWLYVSPNLQNWLLEAFTVHQESHLPQITRYIHIDNLFEQNLIECITNFWDSFERIYLPNESIDQMISQNALRDWTQHREANIEQRKKLQDAKKKFCKNNAINWLKELSEYGMFSFRVTHDSIEGGRMMQYKKNIDSIYMWHHSLMNILRDQSDEDINWEIKNYIQNHAQKMRHNGKAKNPIEFLL
jgi:hypothetical protein